MNRASVAQSWEGLPANARGALWVLISVFFFAGQSASIKALSGELEPFQIVFLRCLLAATFILPFAIRKGAVVTRRPLGHFARGACGVMAMSCMVYAISQAKLADVTSMGFTKVLFTVIIAIVLFRETVGWRRWAAVGLGFAGALIMLRPGTEGFNVALLFALLGSFFISVNIAIIRRLSSTEKPETIIFYFGIIGGALMAVPAILVWNWPSTQGWLLLCAAGASSTLAQSCAVRGWAIGEHSVLAPVQYVQLVYAAAIGFVIFSEVPDWLTIVGAGIIVGSTLYIARREAMLKAATQPASVST